MTKTTEMVKEEWDRVLWFSSPEVRRRAYAPPLMRYHVEIGVKAYMYGLLGYDIYSALEKACAEYNYRASPGRMRNLLLTVGWIDKANRPRFDLWLIRLQCMSTTKSRPSSRRVGEFQFYVLTAKYHYEDEFIRLRKWLLDLFYEASDDIGLPLEMWDEGTFTYLGAEYLSNVSIDEINKGMVTGVTKIELTEKKVRGRVVGKRYKYTLVYTAVLKNPIPEYSYQEYPYSGTLECEVLT